MIHEPGPLAARVSAASTATHIVLAEQERTTTLRNAIEEAAAAAENEMPLHVHHALPQPKQRADVRGIEKRHRREIQHDVVPALLQRGQQRIHILGELRIIAQAHNLDVFRPFFY